MSRYPSSLDCKIYVGDLPKDATEEELESAFATFGPIKSLWVARNPAGFAFVEYEDARDAEDAVKSLDGSTICGVRARVEFSTGKSKPKPWQATSRRGPPLGGRRAFNPDDRCYECGERGHYAYDCDMRRGKGRKNSRPRNLRKSRSESRDRSRSRKRYSRSRSRSRRDSRNKVSRGRSRDKSRDGSRRISNDRSRSCSRHSRDRSNSRRSTSRRSTSRRSTSRRSNSRKSRDISGSRSMSRSKSGSRSKSMSRSRSRRS